MQPREGFVGNTSIRDRDLRESTKFILRDPEHFEGTLSPIKEERHLDVSETSHL